jgi:serine/threonine protein kinase
VDVFASGIMLFIMQTGFPPLNVAKLSDGFYKIIKEKDEVKFNKYNLRAAQLPKDDYTLCPHFRDMIFGMLAYNPAERMTLVEVEQHAWVTGDPPMATTEVV